MDVVSRVKSLGGAARSGELSEFGHTRHELAMAVASQGLTRIARGVYAAPGVDRTQLLATMFGARVTCASALQHHRIALVRRPETLHLEVAKGFSVHGRSTAGVHLHFGSDSTPRGFASVANALAVASGCLSEREHLVAFDSALHQGLTSFGEVASWRSQASARGVTSAQGMRCGVASEPERAADAKSGSRPEITDALVRFPRARREWLLAHGDARAESPLETLARLDISKAGLPVHPQFFVDGVGRVDLLVAGSLVVETDGKEHHDNPRAFQLDRDRDRKLKRRGFRVLRFTYSDVMGPNAVDIAAEVRETLERHAPRRGSR